MSRVQPSLDLAAQWASDQDVDSSRRSSLRLRFQRPQPPFTPFETTASSAASLLLSKVRSFTASSRLSKVDVGTPLLSAFVFSEDGAVYGVCSCEVRARAADVLAFNMDLGSRFMSKHEMTGDWVGCGVVEEVNDHHFVIYNHGKVPPFKDRFFVNSCIWKKVEVDGDVDSTSPLGILSSDGSSREDYVLSVVPTRHSSAPLPPGAVEARTTRAFRFTETSPGVTAYDYVFHVDLGGLFPKFVTSKIVVPTSLSAPTRVQRYFQQSKPLDSFDSSPSGIADAKLLSQLMMDDVLAKGAGGPAHREAVARSYFLRSKALREAKERHPWIETLVVGTVAPSTLVRRHPDDDQGEVKVAPPFSEPPSTDADANANAATTTSATTAQPPLPTPTHSAAQSFAALLLSLSSCSSAAHAVDACLAAHPSFESAGLPLLRPLLVGVVTGLQRDTNPHLRLRRGESAAALVAADGGLPSSSSSSSSAAASASARLSPVAGGTRRLSLRRLSTGSIGEDLADDFAAKQSKSEWGPTAVASHVTFMLCSALALGVVANRVSGEHDYGEGKQGDSDALRIPGEQWGRAVLNAALSSGTYNLAFFALFGHPFASSVASLLFYSSVFALEVVVSAAHYAQRQSSLAFLCGISAFIADHHRRKTFDVDFTIEGLTLFFEHLLIVGVWYRKAKHMGHPQTSRWVLAWFLFYVVIVGLVGGILDGALGILNRNICRALSVLVYVFILYVTFWADRDRPNMKHHIEMQVIYMFATICLLVFVVWFLNQSRIIGMKFGGSVGSSITLQVTGMLILIAWDFISARASTLGSNAPFMYPLYFALDVTNALIYVDGSVNSGSFVGMLLVQTVAGLVKNCGLFEITVWITKKLVGLPAGKFPYRDKDVIEGLIVVSAVDSTSEAIAALAVLGIIFGERIGWWTGPSWDEGGKPPCLISSCDTEDSTQSLDSSATSRYRPLGTVFAVCIVSFLFRFASFSIERRIFRWFLAKSAKVESRTALATIDLKAVEESLINDEEDRERSTRSSHKSEENGGAEADHEGESSGRTTQTLREDRAKETEVIKTSMFSGLLSKIRGRRRMNSISVAERKRKKAVKKQSATSMKTAFDLLNETHWVHHSFSRENDVQVLRYHNSSKLKKGGEKEDVVFKATVTLTASLADLKAYCLGYTDRADDGSRREVLEQIDPYSRVLYRKMKFPAPFKQRDIVFFDLLREFDNAFITWGSPTVHAKKPVDVDGDGTVRLESFVYLQHFQETAMSTPEKPQTRYTYIYSNQVDLFGVPSSILSQLIVHNMTKKVDLFIEMYGRVDESAAAKDRFNSMMEKIDVRHTLGRLFRGNKMFLAVVSCYMTWAVIEARLDSELAKYFEALWRDTPECKSQ